MTPPRQYQTNADRQAAYRQRAAMARAAERAAKNLPAAPPIPTMPSKARWTALLDTARAALDTVANEMQTYHDERSEVWQNDERGEQMQANINDLQNMVSELEQIEI